MSLSMNVHVHVRTLFLGLILEFLSIASIHDSTEYLSTSATVSNSYNVLLFKYKNEQATS